MDGNSSVPKRKGTDAYRRDHMHISLIFMVQRERERGHDKGKRERERLKKKHSEHTVYMHVQYINKYIYKYISINCRYMDMI